MEEKVSISLIIPAYNEEESIEEAVAEAVAVLEDLTSWYEVIVVDDGSTDATPKIVEQLAERDGVRGIHNRQNLGLGAALQTGYHAARAEWMSYFPADGQYVPSALHDLVQYTGTADVITTYYVDRPDSISRLIMSKTLRLLELLLFPVSGQHRGSPRLIRRQVLEGVSLISRSGLLNFEIVVRAASDGYTIKETPIACYPRQSDRSKVANMRTIYQTFAELVRLRLELLRQGDGA